MSKPHERRWPVPRPATRPAREPIRQLAGRARWLAVAFAVVLASSLSPAFAQSGSETRSEDSPGTGSTGSASKADTGGAQRSSTSLIIALTVHGDVTLRESTLKGALSTIGELWGINIVAGDLQGTVNGVFKDAPLREILDTILLSNGYGYRAVGETLVITELSRLGQVNPFFKSATIRLHAANVNDVVAAAGLLTTPQGRIQPITSANSFLVVDFPDRVEAIRELATALDTSASGDSSGSGSKIGPRQLEVAYMKAHFIAARTASPLLASVLSPQGAVTVMEGEDRLLVVDYPENLEIAQRVLEKIDRPRPQVSIRSLIYDISLNDIEQLGVNWSSLSGGSLQGTTLSQGGTFSPSSSLSPGTGTFINSVTATPFTDGSTGGAFSLYNLGGNLSLAAIALMLQQADDSRLLASPNITVTENQQATIEAVSEIPFQQLTQTGAGGNIGTTAFKEAGVSLQVRPKIAADHTVEMYVRPEFSVLSGFTPGENQPIIDRRTAETTVRVANGHTLVLGGMRQRSDVGAFAGVPFLKDVRVLGHLFRSRSTNVTESELVVFITPTIVGFDTPSAPRNQQIADTVASQLNRIPPPEGGNDPNSLHGGCDTCFEDRYTSKTDTLKGGAPLGYARKVPGTQGPAPTDFESQGYAAGAGTKVAKNYSAKDHSAKNYSAKDYAAKNYAAKVKPNRATVKKPSVPQVGANSNAANSYTGNGYGANSYGANNYAANNSLARPPAASHRVVQTPPAQQYQTIPLAPPATAATVAAPQRQLPPSTKPVAKEGGFIFSPPPSTAATQPALVVRAQQAPILPIEDEQPVLVASKPKTQLRRLPPVGAPTEAGIAVASKEKPTSSFGRRWRARISERLQDRSTTLR